MFNKLRGILTKRDKKFFLLLLLFSIVVSTIEVIGISAIMPFLSVSMDFTKIHSNEYLSFIYSNFNFTNDISFIIFFGVVLFAFYIFRSLVNIFFNFLMAKFSQGRYHLIVHRLFENYMGLPYKQFVEMNSSTLTKTIITEAKGLSTFITAVLMIFSESIVIIFIYMMMLYVNYEVTLVLTAFLLINGFIMLKTVSKKIKKQGVLRAEVQKSFYEIINKSFANFKLIKLQSNDQLILNDFEKASHKYAKINIIAQTLIQVPKFILEAIAFGLIILIVVYLVYTNEGDISNTVSMLSMFVLALYRLMPSVTRIMGSYNNILFVHKSLDIIHNDLMYDNEDLGEKSIDFKNDIKIDNLYFEYKTNKPILNNISLTIEKGSSVAFIGESGSGKSTLVDIIMGLYKPTSGKILVDGISLDNSNVKQWKNKIGYIPQSVYLFDGTVEDNIVFGNEYNKEKIIKCLKQAEIYNFLEKKEGLKTFVGEGGVMLSGGQKQRIAIARALYTDPEVLVLDEATSALDNQTETIIMDEIYNISQNKTLIVIAHRLSTIKNCDKVYRINNGEIEIG